MLPFSSVMFWIQDHRSHSMQRIRQCKSLHNDEPTELENLLDMIIALEESGEAELQETQGTASKKLQY